MAMLAEKRTKTKYFLHHKALNPRGNLWCEDSNKIGQRLLEKMGWSPGKGLGVGEDGVTDPIRISYKWDNKGMGFKGGDGLEDVAQQTEFNSLLAQLSSAHNEELPTSEHGTTKSPKSLELVSQKSRARVHYHKFTRGKDLSRASSKDLACILGVVGEKTDSSEKLVVIPDITPPIETSLETTFGVTTIARGSYNDYFKQKFQERKSKNETQDEKVNSHSNKKEIIVENEDIDDEVFEDAFVSSHAEEKINNKREKKSKRNKSEGSGVIKPEEVSDDEPFKKRKKSKSKCAHDSATNSVNVIGEDDLVDDELNTTKGRRKSVTWGDVEVSFVSKYIKDMVDTSSESLNADAEQNINIGKTKKKKKKNKGAQNYNSAEHQGQDHSSPSDESCASTGALSAFSKEAGFEDTSGSVNAVEELAESTKKRKEKKKKLKPSEGTVRIELESNTDFINVSEEEEVQVMKVKRKKKKEKEIPTVQHIETLCVESEVGEEVVNKHKKGKKRLRETELVSETSDQQPGDMENVTTDIDSCPPIKKKKKKQDIDKQLSEVNSSVLSMDVEPPHKECEKQKKKMKSSKVQRNENDVNDKTVINCTHDQNICLSSLTQERMAKWKQRKENNKMRKGDSTTEHTQTLKLNPNIPTQDYNGRKVLAAMRLKVKVDENKEVVVSLPPSNFDGSNLDSIVGYGQGLKSR